MKPLCAPTESSNTIPEPSHTGAGFPPPPIKSTKTISHTGAGFPLPLTKPLCGPPELSNTIPKPLHTGAGFPPPSTRSPKTIATSSHIGAGFPPLPRSPDASKKWSHTGAGFPLPHTKSPCVPDESSNTIPKPSHTGAGFPPPPPRSPDARKKWSHTGAGFPLPLTKSLSAPDESLNTIPKPLHIGAGFPPPPTRSPDTVKKWSHTGAGFPLPPKTSPSGPAHSSRGAVGLESREHDQISSKDHGGKETSAENTQRTEWVHQGHTGPLYTSAGPSRDPDQSSHIPAGFPVFFTKSLGGSADSSRTTAESKFGELDRTWSGAHSRGEISADDTQWPRRVFRGRTGLSRAPVESSRGPGQAPWDPAASSRAATEPEPKTFD